MAYEFVKNATLLNAATATGAGSFANGASGTKTYHASGSTSSGTGAATIIVQGSHTGVSWDTIGAISLTLGTSATSDGFTSDDRYTIVRGNVSALSGTGATVTLSMGY